MHMYNRGVCAHVYYKYVHGATLRMCLVGIWCSRWDVDYVTHMQLRLVLERMSLLWHAVHMHGPYSYGLML